MHGGLCVAGLAASGKRRITRDYDNTPTERLCVGRCCPLVVTWWRPQGGQQWRPWQPHEGSLMCSGFQVPACIRGFRTRQRALKRGPGSSGSALGRRAEPASLTWPGTMAARTRCVCRPFQTLWPTNQTEETEVIALAHGVWLLVWERFGHSGGETSARDTHGAPPTCILTIITAGASGIPRQFSQPFLFAVLYRR